MNVAQLITEKMPVSLNEGDAGVIAGWIESGKWRMIQLGDCLAVVSRDGNVVTIEMIEGRGGLFLARAITRRATEAGLICQGWVLNEARVRMAAKIGMRPTGLTTTSHSGRTQIQVST